MSLLNPVLFLAAAFLVSTPAFAQCGGGHRGHSGHSGHGGHGSRPDHSGHQDSGPKVTATNTLCPVMGRSVKAGRDREVVVGGKTYLVCCDGCGPEMAEHREKYLDKDGKPLNAPKKAPEKKDEAKPEPSPSSQHQH